MFARSMFAGAAAAALASMAGPALGSWPDPTDTRTGNVTPYARKRVQKRRRLGFTKKSNAGAYKGSKRAKRATWGGGNPARY